MSLETYNGARNSVTTPQQPPGGPVARPRSVRRLLEWAQSAQAAYGVAEKLVTTSFVPKQFRDKPHEATAAILAGDEVGLSPMASLRAFDIIEGTAAPRALTHRAVVQAAGHQVWVVESTEARAIVRGRRGGESEVQESIWTIERARQLGLSGKENYRKQPKSMLVARATSECCRLIASDALMGMPYSMEELADGVLPDWPPATPPEEAAHEVATLPPRRTARRRTPPRPLPRSSEHPEEPSERPAGPPLPGEDTDGAIPDPPTAAGTPVGGRELGSSGELTTHGAPRGSDRGADVVTRAQLTKLHTIFTTAGIEARDTRLRACELLIGTELSSSRSLTKAQASTLIECLETEATEGDLAEFITELIGLAEDTEAGDVS